MIYPWMAEGDISILLAICLNLKFLVIYLYFVLILCIFEVNMSKKQPKAPIKGFGQLPNDYG